MSACCLYVCEVSAQVNCYANANGEPPLGVPDSSGLFAVYNVQGGYNARAYSVITCKGYPWTWLLEDQSGQFNFRISTSVTADSNVNSSYSHGLNTWNHVVGTYDGASQKIYVDGILRSSTSLSGTINVSSNDALVGTYNYGDYCLTGNVGVVRVYQKALSAAEVLQNYEAQKSKFANTIVQQVSVL